MFDPSSLKLSGKLSYQVPTLFSVSRAWGIISTLAWNLALTMISFGKPPGKQRWYRLLKDSQRDLAARLGFLGSSSMDDGSVDEPLDRVLQSSERSRLKLRNHIRWLTMADALMLGVTAVLNSLGKLPWSTDRYEHLCPSHVVLL